MSKSVIIHAMSEQKKSKRYKDAELLDVDARFLLANDRTLLSWVRTALAIMAGGLAFSQFGNHSQVQSRIGVVATLFGAIVTILGYIRYRAADKAIRAGELPNTGNGPLLQVVGVICFALIIVIIESGRL